MIRKPLFLFGLAVVALLCVQCSPLAQLEKDAYLVRYQELNNYFVRNDIDGGKLQKLIINSQAQFDAYFGQAAVMGRGGTPTPVNFKTQYVLAVLLPETDRSTVVSPVEVLQNGNTVIFNYHVERGAKTGYTLLPFTAIALDKPSSTRDMEFYFNKK